jgi:hypothetical protein
MRGDGFSSVGFSGGRLAEESDHKVWEAPREGPIEAEEAFAMDPRPPLASFPQGRVL